VATLEDSSTTPPLFPLTADALDDVPPKMLAQTVSTFLIASYGSWFLLQDIFMLLTLATLQKLHLGVKMYHGQPLRAHQMSITTPACHSGSPQPGLRI
jgi:hypothetical protein